MEFFVTVAAVIETARDLDCSEGPFCSHECCHEARDACVEENPFQAIYAGMLGDADVDDLD